MREGIDTSRLDQFLKRFNHFQAGRTERITNALSNSAELVIARAQSHYLTGAALHVRTGRLRSSVVKRPASGAWHVGGRYVVDVGSNVWYGRGWELGFFPARVFQRTSKLGKRFTVHMPERTVPPRKWLQPSAMDNRANVIKLLTKAGVVFR